MITINTGDDGKRYSHTNIQTDAPGRLFTWLYARLRTRMHQWLCTWLCTWLNAGLHGWT